jgi:hypothetical protein
MEIYSTYTLISAITETRTEIFAIADQSPFVPRSGKSYPYIVPHGSAKGWQGSFFYLADQARPLLKGSSACGLLLMAPPRSRIAGVSWMTLQWMMNASHAHDEFRNLFSLD